MSVFGHPLRTETENAVLSRINLTFVTEKHTDMLYRKIAGLIEKHLASGSNRLLVIDGARQVGKSYIIRWVGKRMFPNYIEINMEEDKLGGRIFAQARTVQDFYLALSVVAGTHFQKSSE